MTDFQGKSNKQTGENLCNCLVFSFLLKVKMKKITKNIKK